MQHLVWISSEVVDVSLYPAQRLQLVPQPHVAAHHAVPKGEEPQTGQPVVERHHDDLV
jgi:hypothetical protein